MRNICKGNDHQLFIFR